MKLSSLLVGHQPTKATMSMPPDVDLYPFCTPLPTSHSRMPPVTYDRASQYVKELISVGHINIPTLTAATSLHRNLGVGSFVQVSLGQCRTRTRLCSESSPYHNRRIMCVPRSIHRGIFFRFAMAIAAS